MGTVTTLFDLVHAKTVTPEERRRLREDAGLTLACVARVLGCPAALVGAWEAGHRTPRGILGEHYGVLLRQLTTQETRLLR